ncbi:MAG: Flp pilus assembly protein CpaB, partial [Elusimicrobiota bacterium]|nr:Flp pilus assembly protein CpaB [Elusimicrobiota bacterium]
VVPVEKGEQIIKTKLYMLGLDTGISGIIPNDKRAITMVFDKEAISGVIKPGNRVDVIGIFEYEDKDKQRQEVATTILQNVLVISVGRSVLGAVKPVMTSKKDIEKAMVMESADSRVPVSLAVSPSEVEILSLASEKGTIKFSLRAPGDDKIYLTEGTKMRDIFKEISATAKGRAGEKAILPDAYIKEMQRKQQEAVDLLKKYQKK